MKLARIAADDGASLGLVVGDEVALLREAAPWLSSNPVDILAGGADAAAAVERAAGRAPRRSLSSVRLLAPLAAPRKVLAIALNYRDHAAETGRSAPEVQTWFCKQPTSINDPFAPVMMPAVSQALDYEVELVVVIGRRGRHVPRERAGEIIGGYMVGCDVSVRDWQRATPTMTMGKGFDTHAPVGPWITTPDEAGDIADMRLRCLVNGEKRQDGLIADMVFDVAAQIEHLTKAMTLEPGDIIFTGTPAGVGVAHTPPKFLRIGDRVELEIDRLGGIGFEIAQEDASVRIG